MSRYDDIGAFAAGGSLHVVIEASRGSSCKFKHDPRTDLFFFHRPLPKGVTYPFDWGFVPGTCGEDGDPLDALVVHTGACPVGSVMRCRPLGALGVRQSEAGKALRNDRYIMRPVERAALDIDRLTPHLKRELEQFFLAAVLNTGKRLRYLGWRGAAAAATELKRAAARHEQRRRER